MGSMREIEELLFYANPVQEVYASRVNPTGPRLSPHLQSLLKGDHLPLLTAPKSQSSLSRCSRWLDRRNILAGLRDTDRNEVRFKEVGSRKVRCSSETESNAVWLDGYWGFGWVVT